MQRLVWLASYPKSGNTWVRLFLNAYNHPERAEVNINGIDDSLHAADRMLFDRVIGLEASELTPTEIERYRPHVYRRIAVTAENLCFIKVHDYWRHNADGAAIFPSEVTAATLYIVRDPRAVAASYANHFNLSLDEAIADMATVNYNFEARRDRLTSQLHQPLGSWSQHVTSWLDQTELPVHLVRYEDLHAAPENSFATLLQTAGLTVDADRLAAALAKSSFGRLQAQEDAIGFRERHTPATTFFRRGQPEGWREELTPAQRLRIEADHSAVMARLGYT